MISPTMSPMYLDYFDNNHVADVYNFWRRSWTWKSFRWTSIVRRLLRLFRCFVSNLCFRIQFLSDHIMIHSCLVWFLWWLRHGAIGPREATSVVGSMLTDLNSEFSHFNLVIRLSNVQQLALPFCTFVKSRCSRGPLWIQWIASLQCAVVPNFWNLLFRSTFCATDIMTWHAVQAGTRLSGVVFFLLMVVWWGNTFCASNSLELDSHLYALVADWNTGLLWHNCTTPRFRNWVLLVNYLFWFFDCHQLVPHLVPTL